jgi:hypothetical protein
MNARMKPKISPPAETLLPRIVGETETHVSVVVNLPKDFIRKNLTLIAYLIEMSEP